MTVFLELGQRPDEPGPPINGPKAYPADVATRLGADAEQIVARYPQGRSALLPLLHSCRPRRLSHPGRHRVLRCPAGPYRRRSHRGGDVLFDVPAHTDRGLPGRGVHEHAVRDHGRRRDSEALQDHLGIHAGQTTDDGRVTLEHVECNAACDYAPVVMVNWEFFDNQTRRRPASWWTGCARVSSRRPPAARRCAPSGRPRELLPACRIRALPDDTAAARPASRPPSPGCGWPTSGT